jgi:hypothetical protein
MNLIFQHSPEEISKCVIEFFSNKKNRIIHNYDFKKSLTWESQIEQFIKILGNRKSVITILIDDESYNNNRTVNMITTLADSGIKINVVTNRKIENFKNKRINKFNIKI